jgi:hypothetical protein
VIRLLFFVFVGAAVWYGWRVFRRQQARVAQSLKDVEGTLGKRKTVNLERDPKTGVYRPEDPSG